MSFDSPQDQLIDEVESMKLNNDEIISKVGEEIAKPIPNRAVLYILRDKYFNLDTDSFEMRLLNERILFEAYWYLLFHIYDDYAFIDLAKQILKRFSGDTMAGYYYQHISDIFGQVEEVVIDDLKEFIKDEELSGIGVELVMDILEEQSLVFQPEMERPDYLIEAPDLENVNIPTLETPVNVIGATRQEVFDYLFNFMQDERLHPYDFKVETLQKKIDSMSETDLEAFAQEASVDVQELIDLRRSQLLCSIFGPCNPMISDDFTDLTDENGEPDQNKIYGGPRMFLDMQYEADTFLETPFTDWYTKNCQQCRKIIPNRYWAVREPAFGGGWAGCYHSWDCVRKSIKGVITGEDEPVDLEFDEDSALDKQKLVQLTLVDGYESFMNECGIYERPDEVSEEGNEI